MKRIEQLLQQQQEKVRREQEANAQLARRLDVVRIGVQHLFEQMQGLEELQFQFEAWHWRIRWHGLDDGGGDYFLEVKLKWDDPWVEWASTPGPVCLKQAVVNDITKISAIENMLKWVFETIEQPGSKT